MDLMMRRRALMGMGGGKPYDAQVEYLGSTGTQYINTGIVPDGNTGLMAHIVRDDSRDSFAIGLRDAANDTRWCIGASESGHNFYAGYGSLVRSTVIGVDGIASINFLNNKKFKVTIDTYEESEVDLPSLSFQPINNIRLFGSSGVNESYTKFVGKIYFVKISQGNEVITDLIPVRVGSVGYMYDKISGRLLGNDGTGDFVLGNDIR